MSCKWRLFTATYRTGSVSLPLIQHAVSGLWRTPVFPPITSVKMNGGINRYSVAPRRMSHAFAGMARGMEDAPRRAIIVNRPAPAGVP